VVATGTDDPDDPDLFRKAMSGVNRAHKNYQHPRVTAIRQPVDKLPIRTSSTPTGVPLEPPAIDDTGSGDTVLFVRPGLQRKNIRRLKRGEFASESELDLHGLRTFEAEEALEDFIVSALETGLRCVSIIHGKGYRSENRTGVLKPFTVNWLKGVGEVMAFCSALPKDGGTGAVYVMLKSRAGTISESLD
jgi:DNA-nicking Smr family endonuclease